MSPAPRTPDKPITLADLSSDDRRALLEQAREQSKHLPTDVDGYDELPDLQKRIRALMDNRDHLRECPVADGHVLGRLEAFDSRIPPRPDIGQPERWVCVIRCQDCGGATTLDRLREDALAEVDLTDTTEE